MVDVSEPLMYALKVSDGEEPSYRLIRQPQEAEPGEVLALEKPLLGYVWDAAAESLRPPTEAERLEEAKSAKYAELKAAADTQALETLTLAEAVVLILTAPTDPRLKAMGDIRTKHDALKKQVEAAVAPEELEAVNW